MQRNFKAVYRILAIVVLAAMLVASPAPAFSTHGGYHSDRNVVVLCSHQDASYLPPYTHEAHRTYDDAWGGVWTLFNDKWGNDQCRIMEVYYAGTFSFSQRTLSGWITNGGGCISYTGTQWSYNSSTKSFTITFGGLGGVITCDYSNSKL